MIKFAAAREGDISVTRITVLSLSALGDLILALPLLAEIRKRYPQSHITLVCLRKATTKLADDMKIADEVIALPAKARRSLVAFIQAIRRLRKMNEDIVFQTFSSHGTFGNLMAGAISAKIRCGFSAGKLQNALTHHVPVSPGKHRLALNLDLMRRLGHFDIVNPTERTLPFVEKESQKFTPGAPLKQFGDYVVLAIGSDPILAFKRWSGEKWAELCWRLKEDGLTCVFVGAASEREDVNQVIRLTNGIGINLAGETDFVDLAAIIHESSVVVATDGMLLHIASAIGKETVGIFGPTHPEIGGAWGPNSEGIWLCLPCSPCYGSLTVGKSAGCETHECLQCLPVDLVYQAVHRIRSKSKKQLPTLT